MLVAVGAWFSLILMSPPSAWCLISTINDVSLGFMRRNDLLHTYRAFFLKELYQVCL